MKLLFDEDLPPRLADVLQSEFSGSIHVHSCGLGSADDEAIWEYAGRESFTIVSKDSDFQERSVLCAARRRSSGCAFQIHVHSDRLKTPKPQSLIMKLARRSRRTLHPETPCRTDPS